MRVFEHTGAILGEANTIHVIYNNGHSIHLSWGSKLFGNWDKEGNAGISKNRVSDRYGLIKVFLLDPDLIENIKSWIVNWIFWNLKPLKCIMLFSKILSRWNQNHYSFLQVRTGFGQSQPGSKTEYIIFYVEPNNWRYCQGLQ